ncbi:RagB/SusD family nutrient uptake outer membrane protein [Flavobacterium sp. MR2016-29]|uniref:RagB/SusD family nutrient uptake outer membrane protein n=1 Tax=Flavobacterium sp. MR2016-29 TaxID=2783795 RepID=UPI00188D365D|nr:RagB/SusD family nutrient uptake outer membrane protein [Flavobacterium sp. MR2016-29]MBF4491491.1 RagB/SusD family nutrient uptake outer membrane protein [Flavobacterium sp. MR2016-29]
MKTIYLKTKFFIALALVVFFMNSCDSFVEVDLPKSQLTSTTVFEDYATATAALTDIYSKIRDKGILTGSNTGISNQLGNYTDEIVCYGTPTNPSLPFYNNQLLATTPTITEYWNSTYNQIYAANSIIEGVTANTKLSAENINQLEGEALFIRALLHFYLTNLFGEVPYIKQTDYKKNSVALRMSSEEFYQNIMQDLAKAIELLPNNYSSTERIRPNRLVAKTLLARVYLYRKLYAQAENEASSILNQTTLFNLEANTNNVFLIGSKETIWQLKSAAAGRNTLEATVFIFKSGPPPLVALSNTLVNTFSTQDQRKTNWIKNVTNGTTIWYHAFKYKEQNPTAKSLEYSIVFRLAEQYLIRSEARAHLGDLIGAKEDLDKIRNRAGLGNTDAQTQDEILKAVLQERRWEFFTEHGHRFFDLKRLNQIDQKLSAVKIGWNTTDILLPLPQSELSANPNLLPQNQGY